MYAHLCRNFRTIHWDYRNRAGIELSYRPARARICINLIRSPGIDSQPGGQVRQPYLSYLPARLHRLAQATKAGGIVSLESIPGFLKSLKIFLRLQRLAESIPWISGLLQSLKIPSLYVKKT
jgi:hypothetical protein